MKLSWKILVMVTLVILTNSKADETSVESFSEIDMNELDSDPIRFGLRFWDDRPERYT